MFPGRWPNNFEPMWNPGWSTPSTTPDQTFIPQGQFCGGDPNSTNSPTIHDPYATNPSNTDSHFPPPTSHIHDTTHSSRRSPSPHRSEQPVKDDKFPMSAPRSPRHRPRSSRSSRRQPRDSHLTRDVTVPSHSNQSPLILGIPAATSIVKIKPAIATWALFSSS